MRANLVSVEGGPTIELLKELTLLGRDEDCDIRLEHKSISKLHCVIVKTDGLVLVRDLGSTNGTRVNGQRVRRAALLPNDLLSVANLKFKVQFGAEEPDAPPTGGNHELQPGSPDPVQRNALPDVYPDVKAHS